MPQSGPNQQSTWWLSAVQWSKGGCINHMNVSYLVLLIIRGYLNTTCSQCLATFLQKTGMWPSSVLVQPHFNQCFFAPLVTVSSSNNKVTPSHSKGFCSVPSLLPIQQALTVGDNKLPALPPPQIPSCLSKYPPRSRSVWHSNSKCDRGCTCVDPYVCEWLASQGFGRK